MQLRIAITAGIALTAAWLPAQTRGALDGYRTAYQQFGIIGSPSESAPVIYNRVDGHTWGQLVVEGKPLSATQERRTVQTLGDGTQIEQSDSNLFYRDAQGRTRVEQTYKGKTTILIMDPVARFVGRLDPASLTATKSSFGSEITLGGVAIEQGNVSMGLSPGRDTVSVRGGGQPGGRAGGRGRGDAVMTASARPQVEDLGVQNQNGVLAGGTRSTIVIPAGEIGNNRDLHVVNERWYSNDLQMLVKSSNSDPRFGVTTYQLTNIIRTAPDPGLFAIPGSYTVTDASSPIGIVGRGR